MALTKSDKWLIGALTAVFVCGAAVLTGGLLLYRALSKSLTLPEPSGEAPPLQWKKDFLRGAWSRGTCVGETADGGFIVAAQVWEGENGESRGEEGKQKIHLLKTDAGGSLSWETVLDGGEWCYPVAVEEATGGGFFVLANTGREETVFYESGVNSPEAEAPPDTTPVDSIMLIKTDPQGNLEWEKEIGPNISCGAGAGRATDDGGYIAFGSLTGEAGGDFYLVKMDASGAVQWEQRIAPVPGFAENPGSLVAGTSGYFVEQAAGGGYICGGAHLAAEEDGFSLFETDESGILRRERRLDLGKVSLGLFDAAPSPDGGVIVVQGSSSGFLSLFLNASLQLLKFDANGNLEWEQEHRRCGNPSFIAPLCDGGWIALSNTITFYPVIGLNLHLLRFDADGTLRWRETFTKEGDQLETGYFADEVRQTAEGGFIVTGMSDDHIFLLKLAPENR